MRYFEQCAIGQSISLPKSLQTSYKYVFYLVRYRSSLLRNRVRKQVENGVGIDEYRLRWHASVVNDGVLVVKSIEMDAKRVCAKIDKMKVCESMQNVSFYELDSTAQDPQFDIKNLTPY